MKYIATLLLISVFIGIMPMQAQLSQDLSYRRPANITEKGINATLNKVPPPAQRSTNSVTTTLNVPVPYATISAAIAAASPGDIIQVAAGTYNESIDVQKSLSILGAGSGVTIIDRSATPSAGDVVAIHNLAGNVTFDGFTVKTGPASTVASSGIVISNLTGPGTITISNNEIWGVQSATMTVEVNYGVIAGYFTATTPKLIFDHNTVHGGSDNPILVEQWMGPTEITNNTIYQDPLKDFSSSDVIFMMNHDISNNTQKQLISGNTIDMGWGTVYNSSTRGAGISIASSYTGGTTLGGFTNVEISNNNLINLKPSRRGISLWNNSSNGAGGDITNAVIFANSISNAPTFTGEFGIRLIGKATGTQIVNNKISGVIDAVRIQPYNGYEPSATVVNFNSFLTTTNAINNLSAASINGTCNWWGDVSGPTTGSNPGGLGQTFAGTVVYAPWLIYGTDADLVAPGFQLPTTVSVLSGGDVSAADNDFRRIQNAVGCAANGQTIDISGVFDWTQVNALAAYTASYSTSASSDIRGAEIRAGVNNLTITSSAHTGHIIGAGDINDGALIYSACLFADDGTSTGNTNLAMTYLDLDSFEAAIVFGWNNTGTFNGTTIQHNHIELAGDNGDATDWIQNIAIYFWIGTNQVIDQNTITFKANGTRTVGYSGPANPASYGYQSGTTGGTGYNGLQITNNIFQVGATSNGIEEVYGIWENGHNDDNSSIITISGNSFLGRTGDLFDHALKLSSQTTNLSIVSNIFTDVDEVLTCNKSAGHSIGDRFTLGNNTLTRVGGPDGIFIKNVTNDPTPIHVAVYWGINTTIDGETGIRGLNELSTQATHASRATGGASDLDIVNPFGSRTTTAVKTSWGSPGRFTDPDGIGTGAGPVAYGYNTYTTIRMGIDSVTNSTVYVLPGTYNEQVLVNKSVVLRGIGTPKPIINFTGTVSGKPTLFDVSADPVTIDSFHFNVDMSKLRSAIIASGAGIENITVTNNVIDAYGTPAGSFGDRNAVSINYGGSTNYRFATGGVNSITFQGNTVNGTLPTSFFRAGVAVDEGGGTFTGNTLQTISHDILLRFGSNGPVTISNNNFNGGGVELADQNAAAGTFTISNNIFTGGASDPTVALLRIKNNYNSIPHVISTNTFNYNDWALSLENMNSVTLNGNTFTSATVGAHAVVINTKSITSNSSTIVQVPIGATLTNNNFNGVGTGLTFQNHDDVGHLYGTFTLGTPGNENMFASTLNSFITLDGQTGSSDLAPFPNYAVIIGTGGTKTTTMAPWNLDMNAQKNKYDVGTGFKLPKYMSPAERTLLEGKLTHKPDNAALGELTYLEPLALGGGIWIGGSVNPVANDIFAGIDVSALDGVDAMDFVAPPPPPSNYLYLYFLTAPAAAIKNYSIDIKKDEASLVTTAKGWDLKAITDHTNATVTLTFPDAGLPTGFKPVLYELANGHYQNVHANPVYTYTSPLTETVYSFRLLMGDSTKPTVTVTTPNGGEYLVVGSPYNITWTSADATGILRHYIYYSTTGAAPYTLIDSTNGGTTTYSWTPPLIAASNTAAIKVVARDSVLNEQVDVSDHTFTILASNSISFTARAGWNLVSSPMLQGDMSPAGIFGDDYGVVPYYTFKYTPGSGYSIPTTLNMGQGYWLGSNSSQVVDAVGTPLSSTNRALALGFNIIGNPFANVLARADLRFTNGVGPSKNMVDAAAAGWISNVLYGYDGSGYYFENTALSVWAGYWVPTLVSGITIQYTPSVIIPTPKAGTEVFAADNWHVDIAASMLVDGQTYRDRIASFGVTPDATTGFSPKYDAARPPRSPAQEYVEVGFPVNPDAYPAELGSYLARTYRSSDHASWEMVVNTSREGAVTLQWDMAAIRELPPMVKIELRDEANSTLIDMKSVSSYTYKQEGTSHSFWINKQGGSGSGVIPGQFALSQNYPNPFNPTTQISYALPVDATVHLAVFNLLGQKVADIINGEVSAGFHQTSFDASALSGGVYVYRIDAVGNDGVHYTDVQKMLLVK